MDKCNTCHNQYSPDCDWNQGRCPNHPPMLSKPYPMWLLLLAAPFIIGVWMITNPKKVWEQAKKEWDL